MPIEEVKCGRDFNLADVCQQLEQLDADAKAMSEDLKVIAGALTALVELMKQAPVMRAQVRTDVPLIRG